VDALLLKRVLYGISCRNYETAAAAVPGAIGLSSSSVSRTFTRASVKQLQALQDRDLSGLDLVAVFLDGKTFADMTMVLAVGIALTGEKHLLGFVETGTENETVLRSGPRFLDSSISEISAFPYATCCVLRSAKYTVSGVCRFNV
ncbi:MAG: transposase, partial [Nitrospira sp.]|nr:transposase [Nitrospira sp.]